VAQSPGYNSLFHIKNQKSSALFGGMQAKLAFPSKYFLPITTKQVVTPREWKQSSLDNNDIVQNSIPSQIVKRRLQLQQTTLPDQPSELLGSNTLPNTPRRNFRSLYTH
jgi:hypothetical protein